MAWLLDGGLVLVQMVNYWLAFHYKIAQIATCSYMMLDWKTGIVNTSRSQGFGFHCTTIVMPPVAEKSRVVAYSELRGYHLY